MNRIDSSLTQFQTVDHRHFSIVTETFSPEINGVALTLTHLIAGLRQIGHTVSVVRPRKPGRDDPNGNLDTLVRSLPLPGYRGLHIGVPGFGELLRCWSHYRPDVVYAATQGPLGWSAARIARRLRIPLFSGFHTNFDDYAKHYHAGWLHPLILRYLRRFHNRTSGTIVPSAELRDRLRALGFKKVAVLGRGVDNRLFAPGKRSAELRHRWGVADTDPVVLYVGRFAAEKNIALAIKAYRAMRQINPAVKFVLVGEGPLYSTLRNSHPELIFTGVRIGEDLARHYASADIFLFPSETETFGNVTLEAMASGLVVLAYDYAAAHLHVRHGHTGLLVPRGDVGGFLARAVEIASAPQSFGEMRREARMHASSLDWELVVKRFAALLADDWEMADTAVKKNFPSVAAKLAVSVGAN